MPVTYAVVALGSLILGLVVWRANPRRALNQSAAIVILIVALWMGLLGMLYRFEDFVVWGIRCVLALYGLGWVATFTLLLALRFPQDSFGRLMRRTRWAWVGGWLYPIPSLGPWVIPYESTPANPLFGPLWLPLGVLQAVGGLVILGLVGLSIWRIGGTQRYVAQLVGGAIALVLVVAGLRTVSRAYLPAGVLPYTSAVLGLVVVGTFTYALFTTRIFRARAVSLAVGFWVGAAGATMFLGVLVQRWAEAWGWHSSGQLVVGTLVSLVVWGGLWSGWRERKLRMNRREADRLIRRMELMRPRPPFDALHWRDVVEELQEWSGADLARVLKWDGDGWSDDRGRVASGGGLGLFLREHQVASRDVMGQMWQSEAVQRARDELEGLGAAVAACSDRLAEGPSVVVLMGPKRGKDAYTYPELATLRRLTKAIGGAVDSVEVGRRARAWGRLEGLQLLGAGVGHDFKQHLAAVRLLALRLADRRLEPAEAAAYLETLENEVGKMGEFSQRLSKLKEPERIEPQAVDVAVLLQDVADFLAARATRHAIELSVRVEPGLPGVWADPSRVYQALVNLGTNAIDAFERSGVTEANRTLSFSAVTESDGVALAVVDNGPGVPEAVRKTLFEPFVTAETPRGEGLGLYLVWDAAFRLGGMVRHEANKPSGARFVLWLRLASMAEKAESMGRESSIEEAAR
ncbi:sensor histidine kinase [Actomonas aquatica]|uniref:histidine kinase n=1 Tax=Actomonas aquatica TaxID=2866162 RepID=A0ABZ1CEC7_9BACT|nr:ATP-binding protein [Opitutus sp. WL0086]WRQ90041.1 ATP-binding protein [Opitutus sp. WL0086]